MERKKILFISNIADQKIGSFSAASIYAAHKIGLDFHIAANFNLSSKKQRMEDEAKHGIQIHHIDFIRNPFHPGNWRAYRQLVELIRREKIDFIHCNTPIGGVCGRLAAGEESVKKVIYQAHGFHFYKGAPFLNGIVYKWAEMVLAHRTDAIITINQEDYIAAQNFKLKNHGEVYYIPGVGIDTESYKTTFADRVSRRETLNLKKDDVVCISMGDLIPRKNYKLAIQAVAKCKNENLHYLICGDGPELENLTTLVRELGVERQIHFLGFRSDVRELLHIADIFLFTTLQEGMPRSMMEAMATGLPCIASKIRGNTDLLEDGKGGYLVPLDHPEIIAEKLERLSNDEKLRRKMSERNLERILEFDNVKIQQIMANIYEKELK